MAHNVLAKRRFDSPDKQNREVLQGWQTLVEQNTEEGAT